MHAGAAGFVIPAGTATTRGRRKLESVSNLLFQNSYKLAATQSIVALTLYKNQSPNFLDENYEFPDSRLTTSTTS